MRSIRRKEEGVKFSARERMRKAGKATGKRREDRITGIPHLADVTRHNGDPVAEEAGTG